MVKNRCRILCEYCPLSAFPRPLAFLRLDSLAEKMSMTKVLFFRVLLWLSFLCRRPTYAYRHRQNHNTTMPPWPAPPLALQSPWKHGRRSYSSAERGVFWSSMASAPLRAPTSCHQARTVSFMSVQGPSSAPPMDC